MAHDLGDVIPLTVTITDATETFADAGAVACTVTLPDDTVVTPAVSHPSTGRYQVDYPTVQAGRHQVRWLATGVNAGAYVDVFDVRPAAPLYLVSLADAKTQLNVDADVTSEDEQIRRVLEAATGVVERHLGQAVVRRAVAEDLDVLGGVVVLTYTPVIAVTSVASVDGATTWSVGDLRVDQVSGVLAPVAGSWLRGRVVVAYTAGYRVIPAEYLEAAEIIVQHLWETKRGRGGGPRFAGGEDSVSTQGMGYAIPNRALELLGDPAPMVG